MHSSSTIGSVVRCAHDQALLERRARLLEEDALETVDRARRDDGVLQPQPPLASATTMSSGPVASTTLRVRAASS